MQRSKVFKLGVVFAAVLFGTHAWAGRPLTVDDAGMNDKGNGHVELWYAADNRGFRQFNIAPAYAAFETIELGAIVSRESSGASTAYAVQAKLIITPSKKDGCNLGASAGIGWERHVSGNSPFANALATCNFEAGSVHVNAGVVRPAGDSTRGTWGVAFEREVGAATAHIEAFGERGSKATTQVGLRGDIAPKVQLDGTVGRRGSDTLYSLGLKLSF
ncbi:MAG: hypothetical protein ABL985_16395 [Casimicrobium sp.]